MAKTITTKKQKLLKQSGVVKLSETSKLGTYSWSLLSFDHCPGARDANGEAVEVCSGCYSRDGNYRFKNVKKVREDNWEAWRQESFVEDFIHVLQGHTHFRFFDSGDAATKQLAEKIYQICLACPNTLFWIPTRSFKIPKINEVLEKIAALPNVALRHSSDNYNQILDTDSLNSVVITESNLDNPAVKNCSAFYQDGKCLDCRDCYDKSIKTIGYIAHGRVAKKTIKLKQI